MNRIWLAWLAIAGGLLTLNFAYLFDIAVRDAPCIWLGPKSGSLIVLSTVTILIGAVLLGRASARD